MHRPTPDSGAVTHAARSRCTLVSEPYEPIRPLHPGSRPCWSRNPEEAHRRSDCRSPSDATQPSRPGRYRAGSHSTQAQEVLRGDSTPDEGSPTAPVGQDQGRIRAAGASRTGSAEGQTEALSGRPEGHPRSCEKTVGAKESGSCESRARPQEGRAGKSGEEEGASPRTGRACRSVAVLEQTRLRMGPTVARPIAAAGRGYEPAGT